MRIATLSLALLLVLAAPAGAAERYRNPLPVTIPGSGDRVETFADPHVIRAQDGTYYAYTGYSSRDGRRCVRGGTWTHELANVRLALFAMGGPGGHVAEFDYVRVSRPAR